MNWLNILRRKITTLNNVSYVQAEGMVTIVFTAGSNALDMTKAEQDLLKRARYLTTSHAGERCGLRIS